MLRRGGYLPWVGVQSNFGVPGSAASTPSTSDGTTFANSLHPTLSWAGVDAAAACGAADSKAKWLETIAAQRRKRPRDVIQRVREAGRERRRAGVRGRNGYAA